MKVLFFASLREAVGVSELTLEAVPADFESLMTALAERLPGGVLDQLTDAATRIALDQALLADVSELAGQMSSDSELAFLPPVTGG